MSSLPYYLSSLLGVIGIVIFWLCVSSTSAESNQPLTITSFAHKFSSGKITILNEKQIQIENIIYDGTGPAAWFAVGSSGDYKNERPTNFNNITLIPDENGSCEITKEYNGKKNITLTLPQDLKMTDITFLVMYCVMYNHNFGYVEIPKNLDTASLPAVGKDVSTTLEPCKGTSASLLWTIVIIAIVSIVSLVAIIVIGVVLRRKYCVTSELR